MSMSQIDPGTTDPQEDDNLTDEERQALADTAPPADDPPADPAPPAADPEPEAAPPAAEDRLGAAADKLAAAADALATRAAPEPEPAPAAASEPEPAPRDFDAELKGLQQQYDDGDLTLDEFIAKRDSVRDDRTASVVDARIAAENAKRQQEAADAAAANEKARWTQATTEFFKDPAHASLVDNPIKTAAFQAAIQEAGKQVPAGDFAAVLAKARELVGGAAPADETRATREAKFQRQQQTPDAPPSLRDVPNASSHETPGAALDAMAIDALEDVVAAMDPAARDRWLASAPGGLGDNARRVD